MSQSNHFEKNKPLRKCRLLVYRGLWSDSSPHKIILFLNRSPHKNVLFLRIVILIAILFISTCFWVFIGLRPWLRSSLLGRSPHKYDMFPSFYKTAIKIAVLTKYHISESLLGLRQWSQSTQKCHIFESLLKDCDHSHNPPRRLWSWAQSSYQYYHH